MRNSRKAVSTIAICAVLVLIMSLAVVLSACSPKGSIDMSNPFSSAAGMKPGSYTIIDKGDGTYNYVLKDASEMPARTVNYDIPTDPDALKELAYTLYQIGNKTMVTVPYASYF